MMPGQQWANWVNKLENRVIALMSMLSSGKGTIWAAKGGGGLWKKTCSRVFLSDKPDVMRVETQKNDLVGYQVERDWEGDIVTMAYGGERADLCVWRHVWQVGEGRTWSRWRQWNSETCAKMSTSKLMIPRARHVPESSPRDSYHPQSMVEPWSPLQFKFEETVNNMW